MYFCSNDDFTEVQFSIKNKYKYFPHLNCY
nr:MAG TPA: hypothetical protein [Caudoviricetes sp.]